MLVFKESLQYFHGTKFKGFDKEFTVALEVPTKGMLSNIFNNDNSFVFKIGYAYLNPKDKFYSKSLGRKTATDKMLEQEFRIENMEFLFDRYLFTFRSKREPTKTLTFEYKMDRKKIHFINAGL